MVIAAMKLKDAPWKKIYDQPTDHIKKQRLYFADKGSPSQSYGFSSSHELMLRAGPERKLSSEELILLNCGVGKDSWESLGQQDQTNQS